MNRHTSIHKSLGGVLNHHPNTEANLIVMLSLISVLWFTKRSTKVELYQIERTTVQTMVELNPMVFYIRPQH
ncbi:hypothetical protein OUZ56_017196 [Daphnia magna]|uniref:Uncharacterized protein n=1 Tax=Daphnia magna TaxID=35525 RepID=A0ABR0ASU6_9CRUS|nr:hypothetical protein OUZ56_017196 [Daphnia magna]